MVSEIRAPTVKSELELIDSDNPNTPGSRKPEEIYLNAMSFEQAVSPEAYSEKTQSLKPNYD